MTYNLEHKPVLDKKALDVFQALLLISVCLVEEKTSGNLNYITKSPSVTTILVNALYNKRKRKLRLTEAQTKSLFNAKSPLVFVINKFSLMTIRPNRYRLLLAEPLGKQDSLNILNMLLESKAVTNLELAESLVKLKERVN